MSEVTKMPLGGWIFYLGGKEKSLNKHKCSKWMHFFIYGDVVKVQNILST